MKKFIFISAVIVILVIGYVFLSPTQNQGTDSLKTINNTQGSSDAKVKIYIVGLKNSEVSALFADGFSKRASKFIESNKVSVNSLFLTPGTNDFINLIDTIKDKHSSLLLLAPDVFLVDASMQKLLAAEIVTVLFSVNKNIVCNVKDVSPYIWNFGLPLQAYLESYLSYIHQSYAKLGKELSFMILHNELNSINQYVDVTKDSIKELGFKYIGKISLDDRIPDTYSSVKQVFDYNPDVILSFATKKGCQNFLSSISKLNLTFDTAVSFLEGCGDVDYRKFSKESRGIMFPSQYVSQAETANASQYSYQAELVFLFLDKLFFRGFDKYPLAEAITKLDGTQIRSSSGLVMLDLASHGLIQPLHVGKVAEKGIEHVQYLGDVSLSKEEICK